MKTSLYIKFKRKALGLLAYWVANVLHTTLTVKVIAHPDYQIDQQYLFAFWHGKQFLPVLELQRHETKRAVLVSPSKDGDLLCVWLKKLNYEIIRGSSRHKNISSLVEMMRKLKQGHSLGFGIDGPIGPIYKVKPGMTHMAQKYQIPIIPMGSAFSRKWVITKAWDKYEIPKPFAKAVLYIGNPILIGKETELQIANLDLEEAIHRSEAEAHSLL